MLPYLVHLGYALMLCGFIVRDVLPLRAVLATAQGVLAFYALASRAPGVAAWNLLFATINVIWAIAILRDRRRVRVPAELEAMYEQHFTALPPREFLRWWGLGRTESLPPAPLTRDGAHPEWLYFLMEGNVQVSRGKQVVTEIPAGFFIGEMSLMTGRPANADVDAMAPIVVRRWPRRVLHDLRERDPALWIKVQSAIGLDLVQKMRRGDERYIRQA